MKIIEVQITPADAMFHERPTPYTPGSTKRTTPTPVDGAEPDAAPPAEDTPIEHGREKA